MNKNGLYLILNKTRILNKKAMILKKSTTLSKNMKNVNYSAEKNIVLKKFFSLNLKSVQISLNLLDMFDV